LLDEHGVGVGVGDGGAEGCNGVAIEYSRNGAWLSALAVPAHTSGVISASQSDNARFFAVLLPM
jgi:hypothetical protein